MRAARTLKNEQCRLEDSLREEFRVILDKDRDIGQKDIAPQAELKEKNQTSRFRVYNSYRVI